MISKRDNFNEIHDNLTKNLKIYIKAIIEKYGEFIPTKRLNQLKSIKNYDNIIKIYDYGSINGHANFDKISMPLRAESALRTISKIPGFGINRTHKTYNNNNLIINNNTFMSYLIHVFISGTTTSEYFEDLLLHETMHFCGSGGATALKEGINELLTRKIALEKNFKTNGCGYPKEVAIAYELQNIFGENIINKIAFSNNNQYIMDYLNTTLGKDAANLYEKVSLLMEDEFYKKYYKNINNYSGIFGILMKVYNYKKINYKDVYILINKYKRNN